MKGSDLIVKCLENESVEYVFQLPGEETLALTDSFGQSKTIKLVTVHHEMSAGFMAGIYGRLTGRPGVCVSTLGPGATNMVTGIADANVDRAPLVALTGQAPLDTFHKEYHQYVDVVSVLRPVTKWNTRLYKADTIPETIRKAFSNAQAEKPGACHVEVPEDIADQNTKRNPLIETYNVTQPRPSIQQADQAAKLINDSKKPLVLAGNGIIRTHATKAFRQFVSHVRIPVAHTFMGKGALPDDDSLSLYAIGVPSYQNVNQAFEEADVIIAVGYDLVEFAPSFWNPRLDKTIVHIDSTNAEIDESYEPRVQLVGQISGTLRVLTGKLLSRPRNYTSQIRESIIKEASDASEDHVFPIKPRKVLKDLRSVLERDDILVSDVGEHKLWISRLFPAYEPNTVLISNGYASMGIGLPGAIAAGLVYPQRHVVAACGDGGFLMSMSELETAVRLGVKITVLIFRDNAFGSIKRKEIARFGRTTGVDFSNPDYVEIARAFRIPGYRPDNASELKPLLKQAIDSGKTSLIDIPIDYS